MGEYTTDLILKEGLEAIGYTEGKHKFSWSLEVKQLYDLTFLRYCHFYHGRHAEQNDNLEEKQAV